MSIAVIAGRLLPCYCAQRGMRAESARPFLNRWALLNSPIKEWISTFSISILYRRNPVSHKLQTQSNANKTGCCFWMSLCTWILHSLRKGASRNTVKAFNRLNSWRNLRRACIPDLYFFPKNETKVFFFNMFVWHWLQRTHDETFVVEKSDW